MINKAKIKKKTEILKKANAEADELKELSYKYDNKEFKEAVKKLKQKTNNRLKRIDNMSTIQEIESMDISH